jgi:DNA recombination protein RmuC
MCGLACVVGAALGWLLGARRGAGVAVELRGKDEQLVQVRGELAELRNQLDKERGEHAQSRESLAAAQALLDAEKNLENTFQTLAASALDANSRRLLQLNEQELEKKRDEVNQDLTAKENSITLLLQPMQKSLEELTAHSRGMELKREGAYEAMLKELENIKSSHLDLRKETTQLVQALRAPKVRGNWGEMQLRRCVEHAGMVEHASFDVEKFVKGDDTSVRPDLIVRLPNQRSIVVDAKTPLDAFLNAGACEDESLRRQFMADHAAAVRRHLDALSAKAYWNRFVESPDFVVCFLPSEVLFSAALEQDPSLLEYSAQTRVLLATPTTLIALLKAVAYGWQQAQIARDAEQIRDVAINLHKKFVGLHASFLAIGTALRKAGDAYDDALNKAEGHGGLFSIARKMRELKIGEKDIPDSVPASIQPRAMQHDDWPGLALAASTEEDEDPAGVEAKSRPQVAQ